MRYPKDAKLGVDETPKVKFGGRCLVKTPHRGSMHSQESRMQLSRPSYLFLREVDLRLELLCSG